MPKKLDLIGVKFGRLTVVAPAIVRGNPYYYECLCDCGNSKIIIAGALTRKDKPTRSCGCIAKEQKKGGEDNPNYRHGHATNGKRSRSLNIWSGMIDRCTNKKNKKYSDYGGRGINVCERWMKFENFLEDMGEPEKCDSIDRRNNDGNYDPENCRWATQKEQTRNQRRNIKIEFMGRTQNLSAWCEELGKNYYTIHSRIRKLHYDPIDALTMNRKKREGKK